MLRKSLVLISLSFLVLLSGCSEIKAPGDTINPPQSVNSSNAMNEYKKLISKNSSPSEILKFIEDNKGNLKKEDADTAVVGLIEVLKLQLKNYEDKLYSSDFNIKVNNYNYKDLVSLNNIKDEDVKSFLQNAYKDGFKLSTAEGMSYLEIDYINLNNKFSGYVSEGVVSFLNIMSEETAQHYQEDNGLIISLDKLADRVYNTEIALEKIKESQLKKEIDKLYNRYLSAYLLGLNNTPAFDIFSDTIEPERLKSYNDTIQKYKDSKLSSILKEYIELLEKNNGKRTKEILNFIDKTSPLRNE